MTKGRVTVDKLGPKLYSWASILSDDAREQGLLLSNLPTVDPYVAFMPDAHVGGDVTVGAVVPTRGAVVPGLIGTDVGCGMHAVLTQLTKDDLPSDLSRLRLLVERNIPLGAGELNTKLTASAEKRATLLERDARRDKFDPARYMQKWRHQIGTLGAGNHFVEVCLDEEDRVWTFLHSGSRGVGNRLAATHIAVARKLAKKAGLDVPEGLAPLYEDTDEFESYLDEIEWAQKFALYNRAEMTDRVVASLEKLLDRPVERLEEVECHHNYIAAEEHFGEDLWVARKGAINADEGTMGLIPGSMGDRSHVVRGLGEAQSLRSAPHGAGRVMSRHGARRKLSMDSFREAMEGIESSLSSSLLEEHPQAYKPIEQVMEDASSLVESVHVLRQVLNVKGD